MDGSAKTLQLLQTHSGWLRRLAFGLLRDKDDAEDVVQESMVAAWRKPPALDRDVRPWLAEVVRNRAHDEARGRRRRDTREVVAHELSTTAVETPEELLERFQLHKVLTEIILGMEEPFRQTLLLRFFEGLSSAEIAERLETPAGTIRWRLKEGLERARKELDRRHNGQRHVWVKALTPWVLPPALPIGLGGGEAAAPTAASSSGGAVAGGAKAAKVAAALGLAGAAAITWQLTREPAAAEVAPAISQAQALLARARNVPRLTVGGGPPGALEPIDRADSAACLARARTAEAEMRLLEGELRTGDMDFAFEFGEPNQALEQSLKPRVEQLIGARAEVIAQRFACRRWACRLLIHVQPALAAETVMVVHHLSFDTPISADTPSLFASARAARPDPAQSCDDSLSIMEQELTGLRARKLHTEAVRHQARHSPINPEVDRERHAMAGEWSRFFRNAQFGGGQCHREEGRPLFCRLRWDVTQ